MSNRAWSVVDIAALCLIPVSFLAAWKWDAFQERAAVHPGWMLILDIGLLVVFALALGKSKDRRFIGVLIDEACRISLGRLQAFLWTLIILGGLAAMLTVNLARECTELPEGTEPQTNACVESPFSIEIPTEVLVLAGISAVTFTASSILTNQGLMRKLDENRAKEVERLSPGYERRGAIAVRKNLKDATLGDLVRSTSFTDNDVLDLSRIQFLALTLILAGGYLVSLAQGMSEDVTKPVGSFPAVGSGLNALLGISAGVFASLKAIRQENSMS